MALEFFNEADRSWASMVEMVDVMEAGYFTGEEHAELGRRGRTENPADGEVGGDEHDTALADGGTSSAGSAESSGSGEHGRKRKEVQLDGSASDTGEQANQAASKRRLRVSTAAPERTLNPTRVTALETTLCGYPQRQNGLVVDPAIGTSFDSIGET